MRPLKAHWAVRSPAFAGAGLGLCAGVETLTKCPQFPKVSKLTSHISDNSEADSSSLAVRDTFESRSGSLLWRMTENLVKPECKNSSLAASVSTALFVLFCTLGENRAEFLVPGQFIITEGAEPQCVFQLRAATSSY